MVVVQLLNQQYYLIAATDKNVQNWLFYTEAHIWINNDRSVTYDQCGARPTVTSPESKHSDCYQIILLGDEATYENNLPRVVAWQQTGWELNSQPFYLESNTLTSEP